METAHSNQSSRSTKVNKRNSEVEKTPENSRKVILKNKTRGKNNNAMPEDSEEPQDTGSKSADETEKFETNNSMLEMVKVTINESEDEFS